MLVENFPALDYLLYGILRKKDPNGLLLFLYLLRFFLPLESSLILLNIQLTRSYRVQIRLPCLVNHLLIDI